MGFGPRRHNTHPARPGSRTITHSTSFMVPPNVYRLMAVLSSTTFQFSWQAVSPGYSSGTSFSLDAPPLVLVPVFFLSTSTTPPSVTPSTGMSLVTASVLGETTASDYPGFALAATASSGTYSITFGSNLGAPYDIIAPFSLGGLTHLSQLGAPVVTGGTDNTAVTVPLGLRTGQWMLVFVDVNGGAITADFGNTLTVMQTASWNKLAFYAAAYLVRATSDFDNFSLSISSSGTIDYWIAACYPLVLSPTLATPVLPVSPGQIVTITISGNGQIELITDGYTVTWPGGSPSLITGLSTPSPSIPSVTLYW